MTRRHALCLALLAAMLGGCKQVGHFVYLWAGEEHTKTVEAEYTDLAHSTVAVVIYADDQVQYEYPEATLSLSTAIASELNANVELVQVVDPLNVRAYQHENISWHGMDKSELGRQFEADYVLFVAVREYATREPGSLSIYRGHINAEASLFKVHELPGTSAVWQDEYVEVSYPPDGPTSAAADIRYRTDKRFAELLARRFYTHEVPRFQ
jgi:hypothetical protein